MIEINGLAFRNHATFKGRKTGLLTLGQNMMAGMPVDVAERLKTALIDNARHDRRYSSSLHAMRAIIREDGVLDGV